MNKFLWPLIAFIVLVVLLAIGLNLNPREVPSPLVGKPAPAFALPRLDDPSKTFSPEEMKGKVWLLNVWATWCPSCVQEHPVLVEMAKRNYLPIVGFNWKEVRGDGSLDSKPATQEKEMALAIQRSSSCWPPRATPTRW